MDMRKQNFLTAVFLIMAVIAVFAYDRLKPEETEKPQTDYSLDDYDFSDIYGVATSGKADAEVIPEVTKGEISASVTPMLTDEPQVSAEPTEMVNDDVMPTETPVPENKFVPTETPAPTLTPVPEYSGDKVYVSNNETLFIGDSRTVGIKEYSGIKDTDFYCSVGMSVYNVNKQEISVDGVGEVNLDTLLGKKTYGKIYVMLGINELGYDFNTTVRKYASLLQSIREKQPDAVIFVEANLHVSKRASEASDVENNAAINRFNTAISGFADDKSCFYLDVNPIFDDGFGNLQADMTGDGVHLYAKYYKDWIKWIEEETTKRCS